MWYYAGVPAAGVRDGGRHGKMKPADKDYGMNLCSSRASRTS